MDPYKYTKKKKLVTIMMIVFAAGALFGLYNFFWTPIIAR
jgi:hypothetical protein